MTLRVPFGNYADLCKLSHNFKQGSYFRQFYRELSNCHMTRHIHLPASDQRDLRINEILPYDVDKSQMFLFFLAQV